MMWCSTIGKHAMDGMTYCRGAMVSGVFMDDGYYPDGMCTEWSECRKCASVGKQEGAKEPVDLFENGNGL